MKSFVQNIEGITVTDDRFRRMPYTSKHCQRVLMALTLMEEIWVECQAWGNQTLSIEGR